MTDQQLVGGIEFGGTKTIMAVGDRNGHILNHECMPTGAPSSLVRSIGDYFAKQTALLGPVSAIGAGAFGPVVIDRRAPDFGHLLQTNKPGWSGFGLHSALSAATGHDVELVTDVGAAAIGEAMKGALRDTALGVYLTVGTGIGGAIICGGRPLPAMLHPELGHLPMKRPVGDDWPSTCAFHDDCAEGLAAGPAIAGRFGQPLNAFDSGSPQVELVADYLGQLCASLTLTLSPHRIVVGGGVAKAPGLLQLTGKAMRRHLNGYAVKGTEDPAFICAPALGDQAGIVGALLAASISANFVER